MPRRLGTLLLLTLLPLGLAACSGEKERATPLADPAAPSTDIGEPLYRVTTALPGPAVPPRQGGVVLDPIVVHDCRLSVIEKQEVPSQREGVLLVVGTEVGPEEEVPAERLVKVAHGTEVRRFRRLKEDDRVEAGQLLAQLDDGMARDDYAIKNAKVAAAKADLTSAEKTRDEARERSLTLDRLASSSAAAREEVRAAKLTWERYQCECESKREAVRLAEVERNQAQTVLGMHQVRSSIPGIVKSIAKKRGEAVKNLEPVLHVHDLSRLRIEGLIEVEYLPRLRKGMSVIVEPTIPEGPAQTLLGHWQEVTAVAVSPGTPPWIVSAGEDGTVRLWSRSSRHELRVLTHPVPVRCVACAPVGASQRWCLAGCSDGSARLWDLEKESEEPVRTWTEAHKGMVTCVAFSPDGRTCATGGDDREVCLWDVGSGQLRYRLPAGHRAALTALHFTPQSQLVSAVRDNTVRLWTLGSTGARLESTLDRRSGDVACPGVSPDGRHLLLDQGKALRLLSLKERLTECVLENPAEASQFTTFALFAPDGRTMLTAGAAEGRLQLWRCPTAATRPYELRQLVTRDRSPATCAAFAPDGSFAVTGTQDRQVLVWPLPGTPEVERQLRATVTLIEPAVESSARQVRLWAEVANPDGRLLPGTSVTLAIYPAAE